MAIVDGSELIPKEPIKKTLDEYVFYYSAPTLSGFASNGIYVCSDDGDTVEMDGDGWYRFYLAKEHKTVRVVNGYRWVEKRTVTKLVRPPLPEPSSNVVMMEPRAAAAAESSPADDQSPSPDEPHSPSGLIPPPEV